MTKTHANRGSFFILCAAGSMILTQARAAETILHTFPNGPTQGSSPRASLVGDSAGNFYGTTFEGGTSNQGTVFKLNSAGTLTTLHAFKGTDGAYPLSALALDSAGNLYGTTLGGAHTSSNCNYDGFTGCGVIFKVSSAGHFSVLYQFTGGADGGQPLTGVTLDSGGNLYGTTTSGGASNLGVAYKLDTTGTETVLHAFAGSGAGEQPSAGMIFDSTGNLYGSAYPVVFKIDTTGAYSILYTFTNGADGQSVQGGLSMDASGNLYGTSRGGSNSCGNVFEVDTTGTESTLYALSSSVTGCGPYGVALDSAGNLYGTTNTGGPGNGGTVYQLNSANVETTLFSFTETTKPTCGSEGCTPFAGVILDASGNLYGTASQGGISWQTRNTGFAGLGTIFKIDPSGTETTLYTFMGGTDGEQPYAGVALDSAGNVYGTTAAGGVMEAGTVYKVTAAGHESVLYSFTGGSDGGIPQSGVILDSAGNLYGTALGGGTANSGVIYKIDTSGSETVLYSFNGTSDGFWPVGGLTFDSAGNLYGTNQYGGSGCDCGTVFRLSPGGTYTVLYKFTGGENELPQSGVIMDSAGNLYGTAAGELGTRIPGLVYKLDTSNTETVLHKYVPNNKKGGYTPQGGLVMDSSGNVYGTTQGGGTHNLGTLFEIDTTGAYSVIFNFGAPGSGASPRATLSIDSSGNLYGTTAQGGKSDNGLVFKISPAGAETVLYEFKGGKDGSYSTGSVVLDSSGNLYGTTYAGGQSIYCGTSPFIGCGTVFKLSGVAAVR